MAKKVLVTGASGLLGRAIYKEFAGNNWDTLGLAFSRVEDKLMKVDITNRDEVQKVIQDFKPAVVIHSAAERRPDVVEKQTEATRSLNVEATRTICEEAGKVGAFVVYIGTDYIFDGKKPPYREYDEPNPLNKYGQSKLEGEKMVTKNNPGNIALRVPILYGSVDYIEESAVTVLFPSVKDSSKDCNMDHYQKRFPTHVNDVAVVLRQLVERRLQDPNLSGVFHWSGDECMTKYDMAVTMAKVFGLPTDHIKPVTTPSGGATRPYDAHLDPTRLEELGISKRTLFREGIEACLKPYL